METELTAMGDGLEMLKIGHLGGYIIGGDPATQYPDLWLWLVQELGIRSVLDVGCGDGTSLNTMRKIIESEHGSGFVIGIDGVGQVHDRIIRWDYCDGPLTAFENYGEFDLVWSCEFVEHVEERFMPNYLATFAASNHFLLMTHAEPGQPGHHHVNCRDVGYWIGALAAIGFRFDNDLTDTTRSLAKANDNPLNHYARSGLAFVKQ
jgi:SAM-dependent methyltransferase